VSSIVFLYWLVAGCAAVIGAGAGGLVVLWVYRKFGLIGGP
jgi:hypothetical protein